MAIDDAKINEWRRQYGVVSRVNIQNVEYVVRGLQFEELYRWSPYIKESKGDGKSQYDVDPRVADKILDSCILHPDSPDLQSLLQLPGIVIELCNLILSITQFENEDFLINCYIEKLRAANMFYGVVRMRLIAVFGIGILEHLRNLTAEEIIELLVYAEYSTESIGQFTEMIGKPDVLPRDQRGKIHRQKFMQLLFGDDYEEQQPTATPEPPRATRRPKTIDDLERMGERNAESRRALDDVENGRMSPSDYAKAKKDGKIPSFNKQMGSALDDAKTALMKRIEEDKQRYGTGKKRGFQGSVQALLDGKE